MKSKSHKFSMVELMTVVAVVMTLISILFTSIKKSKDSALLVACMSNISQIRTYTELYRKDNGKLPYSEIWLTDFSYAADYMEGTKSELSVFTCAGSTDAPLTSTDQLVHGSSYYYVPGRDALEKNIDDGAAYGFNLLNLASLAEKNQLVIYDKSPDHHHGKINTAYLFSDDGTSNELEGKIVSNSNVNYLTFDGSGQLVLENSGSYGGLNINPSNSTGNLFTLTDPDGNIITVRENDGESSGAAVSITIKVKAQGRTLTVDGEEITLDVNTTYTITATADDPDLDPFYIYSLTQDGNGTGQWWVELFEGVGTITITDDGGNSTTVGGKNKNK